MVKLSDHIRGTVRALDFPLSGCSYAHSLHYLTDIDLEGVFDLFAGKHSRRGGGLKPSE